MRIVYFDLDCIRNDHMGCYGYHRDTTPNIDRLARDGALMQGCYTSNSPCEPSRAALFSGRFGINNGVVGNHGNPMHFPGHGTQRRRLAPMWMRHLRAHDMRPVGFSNFADRHGAMWYHTGFDEHHLINLRCGFETADEVNAVVMPWLESHATEDDYFLHIHYWDPHFPYRVPDMEKWMEMFADEPLPDWPDPATIREIYETTYGGSRCAYSLFGANTHWPDTYPWHPLQVSNEAQYRALIDGYDGSIRYTDHHVGQVLDLLAARGILDDTLIVVGGDHGDNFGERGHYMDHTLASEPVMRRPLIARLPGVVAPGTSDALVYLLDLCPTVCELAGIPVPGLWDGESFAPALRGEPFDGREYLVLDHDMSTTQRAVRTREHLFVQTLHPGLYDINEPHWLFQIDADPHMTRDLAPERPDLVRDNLARIAVWRQGQLRRHGRLQDPMEQHCERGDGFFRGALSLAESLRADGRAAQAADLVARINSLHPEANLQ